MMGFFYGGYPRPRRRGWGIPRQAGPSARSGDLFGKGQVLVMRAIKGRAHPLGQLVGTQQTLRLHHAPLAVHPLGLYRVQPRALLRQKAAYDPNTFLLALLHLPVVLAHPPPNLLAYVPAGVVPHQDQDLLAGLRQLLRAPRKEARSYPAHRSPLDEPQPRPLVEFGQVQPIAGDGLRIWVVFGDRALLQAQRFAVLAPSVQRGKGQSAPPRLVLETHHPPRIALGETDQPVAAPFFRAYSGSGLVIHRLARSHRTPIRSKVAR